MRHWGVNRSGTKRGTPLDEVHKHRGLRCPNGFTLIELTMVIVIIGILAAVVLPSYIKLKDKAKEAETKASLHAIQLDLERFATDHAGDYPAYLIGGDNTTLKLEIGHDSQTSERLETIPANACSDPLIRAGYVESYPRNPFVRNTMAVQRLQMSIGDPLRSALAEGQEMGTRFGAYGTLMGQCLCESRYLLWDYIDPVTHERIPKPTWSNIQYEFFDVWSSNNRRRSWLPGSFMYKAVGEIVAQPDDSDSRDYVEIGSKTAIIPHNNRDSAVHPVSLSNYMLSAWGGYRNKGMDILGEEPLVIFSFPGSRRIPRGGMDSDFFFDPATGRYEMPPPAKIEYYQLLGIPPWTRGVNRSHIGPLWGSPYGPAPNDEEQLSFGNANGFNDALILLLTSNK